MAEPTTRSDWVTFMSDYGLDDHLVGVCKGVVARIAPHVRIIDVCHQVKPQDVLVGATMLAESIPYLPVPAVHLALVDPFRPTASRGVAGLACGARCRRSPRTDQPGPVGAEAGPLVPGPERVRAGRGAHRAGCPVRRCRHRDRPAVAGRDPGGPAVPAR